MISRLFKKVLVLSVILYVNLALFFVGYLFVSNTVRDDYELALKKTAHLKDDFKTGWHKKVNRDAYEVQQSKIIEKIGSLKKRLPNTLTPDRIRDYVSSLAQRNNVKITGFDEVTSHDVEFYMAFNWSMSIEGKYPDVVRWLHELQNDDDLIVTAPGFYMAVTANDNVKLDGEFQSFHYLAYPDEENIYEKIRSEYEASDAVS